MRHRRPLHLGSLRALPPAGLIVAGTPEVTVQLKPVQIRELRDGMWVAVAEDSEPLVVTEAVAKASSLATGMISS